MYSLTELLVHVHVTMNVTCITSITSIHLHYNCNPVKTAVNKLCELTMYEDALCREMLYTNSAAKLALLNILNRRNTSRIFIT